MSTTTEYKSQAAIELLSPSNIPDEQSDSTDATTEKSPENKRQTWSSQLDFIMTAVGCAVGLGNIWRFPYLCFRNGGGAFLIPYVISFFLVAAPTYVLEISLGQYTSSGVVRAWGIVPIFQGLGVASQVIMVWTNSYYIVVIAWALYYIYSSLTAVLPWASCDNPWNTERCFVSGQTLNKTIAVNCTDSLMNATNCTSPQRRVDSVVEYWERQVLQMSSGIDEVGSVVPGLAISLLIAWLLVFLCLFKGVKLTGKIVYFTALFPYVLLTIIFVRGVTLEGALEGVKFYLKPDFTRLTEARVWLDGGTQVIYSMGLAQGFMVTLGGYNKFHSKSVRNGLIIITVNCLTSLYGGLAVFSILGFMAHEMQTPIQDVVDQGPGLVFLTYPKAVTQMPLSPLWSAVFFLTILFVGLDSQFAGVEGFLTPFMDMFPRVLYKPRNRTLFVAGYCIFCYILALCLVTEGGVYLFRLIDYYCASGLVLLTVCFCEVVAIGWFFGADRFYDALELMVGTRPGPWFKICWKFLAPSILLGIFLFEVSTYKPLTFSQHYSYPDWATALGVCFIMSSTICIPGVVVYKCLRAKGSLRQRLCELTTPSLKKHQVHPEWLQTNSYKWRLVGYKQHDHMGDES